MIRDITIGQYYSGNSVIHRMDPIELPGSSGIVDGINITVDGNFLTLDINSQKNTRQIIAMQQAISSP